MPFRALYPFRPIDSTKPTFEMTVDNTSSQIALQATGREWLAGPSARSVRLASRAADDFSVQFGSSLIEAVLTTSMVVLGGTVEIFTIPKPSDGYIAIVSSTDVTVNITLGYGQ